MVTVLLQDIPQLFLQLFIIGRRNAIDGPVMLCVSTAFLCIIITVSPGFAAITRGVYIEFFFVFKATRLFSLQSEMPQI